jgi:6-phosphogluconate dehydrogenase
MEVAIVGTDASARAFARAFFQQGIQTNIFDPSPSKLMDWEKSGGSPVKRAGSLQELIDRQRPSRTVILNGGESSAAAFDGLIGLLEPEDVLLDTSQYYFKDGPRRARLAAERQIRHLSVCVLGSGPEERGGPVLLAGGLPETFFALHPLLEAMLPAGDGRPAVAGTASPAAVPFVQMVFGGIDFALRHLAIETFELLHATVQLERDAVRQATSQWLVDLPLHRPEAALTNWLSQTAQEFGCPIPTIDAAAGMRLLTEAERRNDFATTQFRQPVGRFADDAASVLEELRAAMEAAVLITYAQALAVMTEGIRQYSFDIDLVEMTRLWSCCSGKRGTLLSAMAGAIENTPGLPNILDDDDLSELVMEQQERLRHAVWRAARLRVSVPALAASLDYLDGFRGAWLPVNLIQLPPRPPRAAQRHEQESDWEPAAGMRQV